MVKHLSKRVVYHRTRAQMYTIQTTIMILATAALTAAFVWSWRERRKDATKFDELMSERDDLKVDITEGEAERDAAIEKTKWFTMLFDSAHDMVLVYGITDENEPTQFLAVNNAMCETLDYARNELLGMTPLEIETVQEPEIRRNHTDADLSSLTNTETLANDSVFASRNMQSLIKRVMGGETVVYDSSFVARGGRRIPVQITAQRFGADDDLTANMVVYTIRDTSEREKAAL